MINQNPKLTEMVVLVQLESNMYTLYVEGAGTYREDTLIKLLYVVFKHRFEHLLKGEGFKD